MGDDWQIDQQWPSSFPLRTITRLSFWMRVHWVDPLGMDMWVVGIDQKMWRPRGQAKLCQQTDIQNKAPLQQSISEFMLMLYPRWLITYQI